MRRFRRAAQVRSFAPIARRDARVLILGSMPGTKSLEARQYYAHPRNAFWRIVGDLLAVARHAPYRERTQALKAARIAVWDVLHSCARDGSMDAAIERDSEVANDFRRFFRAHPHVARVFFNGAKAEASFRRHVAAGLDAGPIRFARLPSTSPAYAAVPYARKLRAWRALVRE